jgi:N-acetylneuraminate synthase/N,N'-diacetyllegionaminate synthase
VSDQRCRIIAAIDVNHNGDADVARRLIDAARETGADGVKLQKRTVALAAVRQVLDRPAPRYAGLGPTYRKALERVDLPVEVLGDLCEHAAGLDVLVAPGDLDAWRQLEPLPFTAVKVDPALVTHLPLLEAVGESGRSVIVGVAGSTPAELEEFLRFVPSDVVLMHTVPRRAPSVLDVSHLVALRRLGRRVGHADGSLAPDSSLTAVALGATMIEKALTLDRSQPGPDHATSLVPDELAALIRGVRALEAVAASDLPVDSTPHEMDELEWARPSIVAACPIPRGTVITPGIVALKPPAWGLSPRLLPLIVGHRALYDIAEDDFITFGLVAP